MTTLWLRIKLFSTSNRRLVSALPYSMFEYQSLNRIFIQKRNKVAYIVCLSLQYMSKFFLLMLSITCNLKIISDSRIRSIISKGPKYRFPAHIDFTKCREAIAKALNDYCMRWCKRGHVESNALNNWKLNIFQIIDKRISFYLNNLDRLLPKPKFSFRHLKHGMQEFHAKYVLFPANKADNNVSPYINHSAVYILFWSFEISDNILRNQK